MISVSPQIGEFLIKATHLPDIGGKINMYESKWTMTFEEFQDACRNNKLEVDAYSYEVEKDFWEWEQLESLFKYYEDIKSKWI